MANQAATPKPQSSGQRKRRKIIFTRSSEPRKGHGRWGDFPTDAITALSMNDGATLWRTDWSNQETLVKGKRIKVADPFFTDFFEQDGVLYVWDGTANLHSDWHGDMWAVDAETGKTSWHLEDANHNKTTCKEYQKHGPMTNNGILWNGQLVSKHAVYPLSPVDGQDGFKLIKEENGQRFFTGEGQAKTRTKKTFLGGNQRCVRLSGTPNYLVYGFNSFVAKDGTSCQTSLLRGNCAKPKFRHLWFGDERL